MPKQSLISFWFVVSMVGIAAGTSIVEMGLIPPEDLNLFLAVRIPLLCLGLPAALLFRKSPYSPIGHLLIGLLLVFYVMHGQWYRPFYEYTFFQAMVFYTLLLYPPRRIFLTLLIVGSLLFAAVYIYRFEEVVLNSKTTLNENYFGLLAFAFTLYAIFKVFSEERAFKERALARFGLLGKHSATILHDLKSTVAIPRMYTELAREALKAGDMAKTEARLAECEASLDAMQGIIGQLNRMGQLTQFNTQSVGIKKVIGEVCEVLKLRLEGIDVQVAGDIRVEASHSFIFSVVMNLIMNSIEKFNERRTARPVIKVTLANRTLTYEDNGGGFATDVLNTIDMGAQASDKAEASGLGLFLLQDGIRNMGGRINFANSGPGVRIEIQFKS